jgi:glycosyltransferase involved in cell wall biosynthesis
MTPFFSVIIPSFNHAKFIGKAIQSVISQSFSDFEIIIIDNNSNDDTDKIISQFLDKRIKIIKVNNDGIIAKSRNLGIKESNGKWISFLDSDDYWHENKLLSVHNLITTMKQVDVICHDEYYLQNNRKVLNIYGPISNHIYEQLLYMGNCFSTSATSIRAIFLKDKKLFFREKLDYISVEDYDYWMLLANAGAKFATLHESLGTYFIHETNSSLHLERTNQNALSVLKNHIYSQQKFTKHKDKLWSNVQNRINFEKNLLLKKALLSNLLKSHIIFFLKNPIFYLKYIIYKIRIKYYKNKFNPNN